MIKICTTSRVGRGTNLVLFREVDHELLCSMFIFQLSHCVLVRAAHECAAQVQLLCKSSVNVNKRGHISTGTEMKQPWKLHSFLAVWKELPHQVYAEVAPSRIGPSMHQPNL